MSEMMSKDYEAEQMMTPEQAELSEVRHRHIAANPGIKKLPGDFSGYVDRKSPTTGFLSGVISGTFDGQKVDVMRNSFGEGQPWRYKNIRGSEVENPQGMFEELGFVTRAFVEMQNEEKRVQRRHEDTRRDEERKRIQQAQIEEARRIEDLKTQEFNKILDQLGENVKVLDQGSEKDKDLLVSALKELAASRVNRNGELHLGYATVLHLGPSSAERGNDEQYARIKTRLLDLLGATSATKPKQWVDPIYGFVHSETYDTELPGVIVRESYHHQETNHDVTGNRAVLRIEDNPNENELRLAARSW